MENTDPKRVNFIKSMIGVNSLRLGGLHIVPASHPYIKDQHAHFGSEDIFRWWPSSTSELTHLGSKASK